MIFIGLCLPIVLIGLRQQQVAGQQWTQYRPGEGQAPAFPPPVGKSSRQLSEDEDVRSVEIEELLEKYGNHPALRRAVRAPCGTGFIPIGGAPSVYRGGAAAFAGQSSRITRHSKHVTEIEASIRHVRMMQANLKHLLSIYEKNSPREEHYEGEKDRNQLLSYLDFLTAQRKEANQKAHQQKYCKQISAFIAEMEATLRLITDKALSYRERLRRLIMRSCQEKRALLLRLQAAKRRADCNQNKVAHLKHWYHMKLHVLDIADRKRLQKIICSLEARDKHSQHQLGIQLGRMHREISLWRRHSTEMHLEHGRVLKHNCQLAARLNKPSLLMKRELTAGAEISTLNLDSPSEAPETEFSSWFPHPPETTVEQASPQQENFGCNACGHFEIEKPIRLANPREETRRHASIDDPPRRPIVIERPSEGSRPACPCLKPKPAQRELAIIRPPQEVQLPELSPIPPPPNFEVIHKPCKCEDLRRNGGILYRSPSSGGFYRTQPVAYPEEQNEGKVKKPCKRGKPVPDIVKRISFLFHPRHQLRQGGTCKDWRHAHWSRGGISEIRPSRWTKRRGEFTNRFSEGSEEAAYRFAARSDPVSNHHAKRQNISNPIYPFKIA